MASNDTASGEGDPGGSDAVLWPRRHDLHTQMNILDSNVCLGTNATIYDNTGVPTSRLGGSMYRTETERRERFIQLRNTMSEACQQRNAIHISHSDVYIGTSYHNAEEQQNEQITPEFKSARDLAQMHIHKVEKFYVRTHAATDIENRLVAQNVAIVTGHCGDGKTFTATHVLRSFSKGEVEGGVQGGGSVSEEAMLPLS